MRCALLPVLLVAALPCIAQADHESASVITIFRGKPASAFAGFTSRDAWGKHMHQEVSIDGKPVVDVHKYEFASFPVSAGRHLVAFSKYGPGSVSVDLKPGERVFIYPQQFIGLGATTLNLSLTLFPCEQAIELGRDSKPAEAKDVLASDLLQEGSFPTSCNSK